MGCNCKKTFKPINNLNNAEYIESAREIMIEFVDDTEQNKLSDMEVKVIFQVYSSLYPAASSLPTLEDAITQIKNAINDYDTRKRKKRGR